MCCVVGYAVNVSQTYFRLCLIVIIIMITAVTTIIFMVLRSCALILFIQTLALYKSFTYLLTYLLTHVQIIV